MGANANNWHTFITPGIKSYSNCTHSTTGLSPMFCHQVNPVLGNPLYDNIMINVYKAGKSIVVNDKKTCST
jgi:hypothetical protein